MPSIAVQSIYIDSYTFNGHDSVFLFSLSPCRLSNSIAINRLIVVRRYVNGSKHTATESGEYAPNATMLLWEGKRPQYKKTSLLTDTHTQIWFYNVDRSTSKSHFRWEGLTSHRLQIDAFYQSSVIYTHTCTTKKKKTPSLSGLRDR